MTKLSDTGRRKLAVILAQELNNEQLLLLLKDWESRVMVYDFGRVALLPVKGSELKSGKATVFEFSDKDLTP